MAETTEVERIVAERIEARIHPRLSDVEELLGKLSAARVARERLEQECAALKARGPMAESAGWLEPMAAAALLARAEKAEKEHREVIGHLDRLLTFGAGVGKAIAALGYEPGDAAQTLANVKSLVARAEKAERERDEAREGEDAAHKHSRWVQEECAKRIDESKTARERAEAKVARLEEQNAAQERHSLHVAEAKERAKSELEKARADNAVLRESLQKFRDSILFGEEWGAWFCVPAPNAPKSHPNAVGEAVLRDALTVLDREHPGAALLERLRALEKVREAVEPYRAAAARWPRVELDARDGAIVDACAAADALKEAP